MSFQDYEQASVWIEALIQDFIGRSPENNLGSGTGEKAFAGALVGFSRGGDPLYEEYKEVVGPYHWTPREIFALTFPEQQVDAEELTVISWVLPHIQATKKDNRKETFYPSERWARARIFGEEVNAKLRRHVVEALRARGYDAVAPQLSPQWERKTSDRFFLASTWSERHAAYASGLGTFGLCDGLITAKGRRCGRDRLSHAFKFRRRPGRTAFTGSTVSFSATEPVESASRGVRLGPSRRPATTNRSALLTYD